VGVGGTPAGPARNTTEGQRVSHVSLPAFSIEAMWPLLLYLFGVSGPALPLTMIAGCAAGSRHSHRPLNRVPRIADTDQSAKIDWPSGTVR